MQRIWEESFQQWYSRFKGPGVAWPGGRTKHDVCPLSALVICPFLRLFHVVL